MNDISEQIKQISEIEYPENLHGKIMRKLAFLQFRMPFFVVVALLLLNLVFSGYNIWLKISGTEVFSTLRLLFEGFDGSAASFTALFAATQNLFPVGLVVSFTINIMLFIYIVYIYKSVRKLGMKKSESTIE